jgi:hypothetical protein
MRIARGMALLFALGACTDYAARTGDGDHTSQAVLPPCPTATPPAGLNPASDPAAALEYVRQLRFHPGVEPYGERRRLTELVPDSPAENPRFQLSVTAEVQPETCSHRNDPGDLQGGNGRVVARIITDGGYGKLGLPADTSYLWVDSLVVTGDSGVARGVIIPAGAGTPEVRRIRYRQHEAGGNRAWSEARLLFTPEDDQVWESCVKFGCCILEEVRPSGAVLGG